MIAKLLPIEFRGTRLHLSHRGAAKRFKITGTGKLIRMHSGKRHLLGTKAPKRMRKLKKLTQVNDADFAKTMQMLPYGLK